MSYTNSIPRSTLPRSSNSSSFNLSSNYNNNNNNNNNHNNNNNFPSSSSSSLTPTTSSSSNNNNNNRPMIDRLPSSTFSVMSNSNTITSQDSILTSPSTPVATNSALNKVGSASSSLYQNCRTVLDRLERVPGFKLTFITSITTIPEDENNNNNNEEQQQQTIEPHLSNDPVSRSLQVLRLGSSLCYLFNALGLDHVLDVNPAATMANLKACQRGTAHFIMACKQDLRWSDGDLFAIHELYGQDTNGVVKVINTVTKLLDVLESEGLLDEAPIAPIEPVIAQGPTDDRTMVVKEILDSERKYVQDLEVLQDYQRQVLANDIITQDQIHELFLNLNSLADFQRRFLIGVEANASQPPEQQRFGHLFLQMEDNFSVYEPYCANLTAAQDLAIAENLNLVKLSHVLDPVSELAPLLIKPVQRLCKYPLLLQTLLKNTPDTHPYHSELADGLKSIMRVTEKVNETKRREDNRQAVIDLSHRVEDWKGHDIKGFGELLLQETFFVIKNDSEREYNVYLFERIILCCKEAGSTGKKSSKSNSILKKPASRKPTSLQLKGRIFVNNVTGAESVPKNGQCLLEVKWRGDVVEEAFTIKCRTEELLKQWQRTIRKAVDETPTRRRAHHLSNSRRTNPSSGNPNERSSNSPYSQFPATPLSEYGPNSAAASTYSFNDPTSPYLQSGSNSYGNFEDEGDEGTGGVYDYNESGRSTPSGLARRGPSIRSLPPSAGDDGRIGMSNGNGLNRPRVTTEDATSAVINQWRNQTPLDGPYPSGSSSSGPSLPRGASHASVTSESQSSLRSSASSRQLKHRPSNEWSSIPTQHNSTSPGIAYAYGNSRREMAAGGGDNEDGNTPRPGVSRQASQVGSNGGSSFSSTLPTSMARGRSASSPNIYQQQPNFNGGGGEESWSNSNSASDLRMNGNGLYGNNSIPSLPTSMHTPSGINNNNTTSSSMALSHKSGGTNSGGTLASASSISASNRKRFSTSSNSTDRSSGTSNSPQPSVNGAMNGGMNGNGNGSNSYNTLPGSLPPSSSLPPLPNGIRPYQQSHHQQQQQQEPTTSAVRVKVTFGDDTFVVVVLSTVSFRDLQEKVIKKIRLCGDRSNVDINQLRLRYQDEDGDKILITSEEDVAMAFEFVKLNAGGGGGGGAVGGSTTSTLVLFATAEALA